MDENQKDPEMSEAITYPPNSYLVVYDEYGNVLDTYSQIGAEPKELH